MTARSLALVAIAAVGAGCAFGPGEPYARLEASLTAGFGPPADRDAGDGFLALHSGYEVRFETVAVHVDALEVVASSGEPSAFDPAVPPPGYSLCHNGHCHADDGRLVPYDEVAAELGAGPELLGTVLALPGGIVDGLDEAAWPFPCRTGCSLPRAHVGLVRLTLGRLTAAGHVRDGSVPARFDGELPMQLDIPLAGELPAVEVEPLAGRLEAAVSVDVSEREPPRLVLGAGLGLDVAWLDDTDLAALVAAGAVDLGPVADDLRSWLAGVALAVTVEQLDE